MSLLAMSYWNSLSKHKSLLVYRRTFGSRLPSALLLIRQAFSFNLVYFRDLVNNLEEPIGPLVDRAEDSNDFSENHAVFKDNRLH